MTKAEAQVQAYEMARDAMGKAQRQYDTAVKSYRAGEMGDAEYLAERAILQHAVAVFDAAFAVAAGWAE